MAIWSSRSPGYKLGVVVLFLGSACYFIGFSSPFWFNTDFVHSGLWMVCSKPTRYLEYSIGRTCASAFRTSLGGNWFIVVQAMESLGSIGIAISCTYAFVVNCFQSMASYNRARVLEIMTGLSGLCGFIGCMVFVGKMQNSEVYGWAFGVNLTGCLLLLTAAVIIVIANLLGTAQPTDSTVTSAGVVPLQAGGMVMVQQVQSYPPPLQGHTPQPGKGVGYPGYVVQYPGSYPPASATHPAGYAPPSAGYAPSPASYAPPSAGYASPMAGSSVGYTQSYSGQGSCK